MEPGDERGSWAWVRVVTLSRGREGLGDEEGGRGGEGDAGGVREAVPAGNPAPAKSCWGSSWGILTAPGSGSRRMAANRLCWDADVPRVRIRCGGTRKGVDTPELAEGDPGPLREARLAPPLCGLTRIIVSFFSLLHKRGVFRR